MMRLFAVYDEKAEAYGSIICCATQGLAIRAFGDACADRNSPMAQNPEDYKLMCLGEYEPNSGRIVPLDMPKHIASASAVIAEMKSKQVEIV